MATSLRNLLGENDGKQGKKTFLQLQDTAVPRLHVRISLLQEQRAHSRSTQQEHAARVNYFHWDAGTHVQHMDCFVF